MGPVRHEPRAQGRAGFTLVEVCVALILLTFGILGLAGTTGFVVRQVELADVTTERSAARQVVVERLRATPYASVAAGSQSVGAYTVVWSILDNAGQTTEVRIVTQGPGLKSGSPPYLAPTVSDTLTLVLLKP
jgi:type IV pilus assembly protein PilV